MRPEPRIQASFNRIANAYEYMQLCEADPTLPPPIEATCLWKCHPEHPCNIQWGKICAAYTDYCERHLLGYLSDSYTDW